MSKRRLARENCLQSLYSSDIAKLEPASVLASFQMEEFALEAKVFEFYKTLYSSTITNITQIDNIIKTTSLNWEMDRMPAIDRSILRMAVCEMMILSSAPVAVIIDEAIELAKKYSTEKSGKFVNGVLDSIARQNNLVK
ncbi:MAG: transcription antitermination factor NusB [Elusimicrobia bacterium GWA2_61_42]|nr:MAG: transcription antitermination factor NusB [Elusimicrobia bacterium GWA2_61_42]OGR77462.1 MAG: transcription antitermination factor NusB [Elusimicrobia bacterium GWC2_61_25]